MSGRVRAVAVAIALLLGVLAISAWVASRAVHFVGTDERGFVTVFQGVPYDLPGGIELYGETYVSGVPIARLSPADRRLVLAHEWRSRDDALRVTRALERRRLAAGTGS